MSFGYNSIINDDLIGFRGYSDSKSDNLCIGEFGVFDISRGGITDISIQDINVNLKIGLNSLSHRFKLFKDSLLDSSVTEFQDQV